MRARATRPPRAAQDVLETATPIATYRPPSANAAAISGPGAPPEAASRIASTPQVGASTHEIGCTQSGSSVIGTRKPATSQTGYSRRFPSAQAVR